MYKHYLFIFLFIVFCVCSGKTQVGDANQAELPCKEDSLSSSLRYTPHYSMDSETLNHATVQRDSAGRLTYFELHVAIQADRFVEIELREKDHSYICQIDVGVENNDYTNFRVYWKRVQHAHTPSLLSLTEFKTFYIKVDNGTVQFGKGGDSTPLISHYDDRFRSLGYFRFLYLGANTSKIRYDCPHVTESS